MTRLNRKFRPALPLSATLVAVVLIPFLLAVGITGGYSIAQLERHTAARMQKDIELIARAIRLPVSHAMERGHEGTVEQALESAFSINRVYGVYVYDSEGNTVYASGDQAAEMQRHRVRTIVENRGDQSEFSHAGGEEIFSYFVPLVDAGERISGLLQVTRRGRDFEEYLADVNRRSLSVIVAATAVLSLIIMLGHRWAVGRHLAAIKNSLLRIRRNEPDHRLEPQGPRELQLLSASINEMLDAIEQSHRQVARQNRREGELTEKLHQAQKLAALGQLAAGVAHELGSPLSTIDGRAQRALRENDLPDPVRGLLNTVREQASRMSHTIRQLLDFGRTNPLKRRRMTAAQPLESALKLLAAEVESAVAIECALDPAAASTRVRVDAVRLEQALLNLLHNALQAARSRVVVYCRVMAGAIHYGVEDDGPGIAANNLPRLFEPFFTTKPTGQGTGLGLAVALAAARDHGGDIEVDSNCPGCTRFWLVLPPEEDVDGE